MILDAIVAAKRQALLRRDPAADRRARDRLAGAPPVRSLSAALRAPPGPRVIAEIKRRSPPAGPLRPGADAGAIARDYAAAGAAALSILTDEEFFDGRLADLGAARAACALPILRKDFVLDERDLTDARVAGADAALLIVRILAQPELERLLAAAAELGLEALVEVHSDEECRRALGAGARVVGVNHRDLDHPGRLDLELTARLAPLLGGEVTRVAESGIHHGQALRTMRDRGYHAALIGEALLRQPSPGAALMEMLIACG